LVFPEILSTPMLRIKSAKVVRTIEGGHPLRAADPVTLGIF
jgi:hypothetical protein